MYSYSKHFNVLLLILVYFLLTLLRPLKSFAYFIENFTSGFDNELSWSVSNSAGISFSNGYINLSPSSLTNFPFIRSNSDIISSNDNYIEIKFKYTSIGSDFGDGIAITDVNPPLDTIMTYPDKFSKYTIFYVWQGPAYPFLHIVTFLCPSTDQNCNHSPTVVYNSNQPDLGEHILKVIKNLSTYEVYLDGTKYFTSSNSDRIATNVWIGHPEKTLTGGYWAQLSVDYIKILENENQSPGPSAMPSGKPSPTPNNELVYYSQSDVKWAAQIYDHAAKWAQIGKQGIDRWGCAISSIAMMLSRYGIKTVSGAETTPSTLNNWLKLQPDGYIGNGLVNWLAVTRYVHESKTAGKSPIELEFKKQTFNQSTTDEGLANGKFPILGLPGHFVLSYMDEGSSYKILDPADRAHNVLGKSDNILTDNTYTPSQTDLSYMMYSYDPELQVAVKDPNGNPLEGVMTEEYLTDDIDLTEAAHTASIYRSIPDPGRYSVEIVNTSDKPRRFEMYLYDVNGTVFTKKLEINSNITITFDIKYDKQNIHKSRIDPKLQSLFSYIRNWKKWVQVFDLKNRFWESSEK